MIIDYGLSPSSLPSERDVYIQSRRMERDGHEVTIKVMRALDRGEIKYIDGVIHKFCVRCVEYYPVEEFHTNGRHIYGRGNVCKECSKIERRIKKHGVPAVMRDTGCRNLLPYSLKLKLKEENENALKMVLGGEEDKED